MPTHSEEGTYRATLQARTVDGEPQITLRMTDREAVQLGELLTHAQHAAR